MIKMIRSSNNLIHQNYPNLAVSDMFLEFSNTSEPSFFAVEKEVKPIIYFSLADL